MDPTSFALGALSATLLITLARVVRGIRQAEEPAVVPPAPPTSGRAVDPVGRPSTAPLGFLATCKPEQLARRLMREHPYLAAYVLEQLEPGYADQALLAIGEPRRSELVELLTHESPLKVSGEAFIALLARLRQPDETDLA